MTFSVPSRICRDVDGRLYDLDIWPSTLSQWKTLRNHLNRQHAGNPQTKPGQREDAEKSLNCLAAFAGHESASTSPLVSLSTALFANGALPRQIAM